MKNCNIHIRDPFVFRRGDEYFMYGTRGASFGCSTGGFDVYKSTDLVSWEGPTQIFDSAVHGLDRGSNWAPELHGYKGKYYLFATFEQENGLRGTYALVSDAPDGEFRPHSEGALTPKEWMSLDGTLYVDEDNQPWLIFCHEHVQILNGTVNAVRLSDDLTHAIGEPVTLFSGTDAIGVKACDDGSHYITDGPFMYKGRNNRLYMIWSTFLPTGYAQCICVSDNGRPDGKWTQLPPIFDDDGGHGMIFRGPDGKLMLSLHTPNRQPDERPAFFEVEDTGETIKAVR